MRKGPNCVMPRQVSGRTERGPLMRPIALERNARYR